MSLKRIVTVGLRVFVSGGLLLFVFSLVPLKSVARSVGSADLNLLVLACGAFLLLHYVSAWKLYYLIMPQQIVASVAKLYEINLVSHFYGCVLPVGSAASSVVRWHKLSTLDGQRAQAFAAIVLNRILEFLLVSGIGVFAWALDPHPGRLWMVGVVTSAFLTTFIVIYAMSSSVSLLTWVQGVVKKLDHFVPVLAARLGKIAAALSHYPRLTWSEHSRLLALALLRNILGVLALYSLAIAIGLHISLLTIAWVRSATVLLTFVPLSLLGLGVREVSLLYLLHPYDVSEASAVALGLLYLAANLSVAAIGGIIEFRAIVGRSAAHHKKSAPP